MTTLLASTGRQSSSPNHRKRSVTHCHPSVLAETMQAEEIRLPESQEDMQLLLLTLREDLITAKVSYSGSVKQ